MDPTTLIAVLGLALPVAIKIAHMFGVELPFLTYLADLIANRPQKVTLP